MQILMCRWRGRAIKIGHFVHTNITSCSTMETKFGTPITGLPSRPFTMCQVIHISAHSRFHGAQQISENVHAEQLTRISLHSGFTSFEKIWD